MAKILADTHPDAHCELDFNHALQLAVATILRPRPRRGSTWSPRALPRTRHPPLCAPTGPRWRVAAPDRFFRTKTDSLIKLAALLDATTASPNRPHQSFALPASA